MDIMMPVVGTANCRVNRFLDARRGHALSLLTGRHADGAALHTGFQAELEHTMS
jgi:hypothetical protein